MFNAIDHAHMAHALRLAARGSYTTQPNPRVGCVLAQAARVVGAGWHERAGEAHAEVAALRAAGADARGATAYVTLEPCSHVGRTPPCADALIQGGIRRVVAAAEDTHPLVDGDGLQRLRAAGIAVETGLMRAAARDLNRGFFSRVERGRPWVRVKLAMSLDGRTALASGQSHWITAAAARTDVQYWRARSSAIMTGSGTVQADNPRLTLRGAPFSGAHRPLRVVLDRALRTPPDAHVLDGSAPTLILHAPQAEVRDGRYDRTQRAAIALDAAGALDLERVLALLAGRGVNELQVEAGPRVCGALFAHALVDELLLYVAPLILGDRAQPLLALPPVERIEDALRLRLVDERRVGADMRLLYARAGA